MVCSERDLLPQLHASERYHQILSHQFQGNYKTENNLQREAGYLFLALLLRLVRMAESTYSIRGILLWLNPKTEHLKNTPIGHHGIFFLSPIILPFHANFTSFVKAYQQVSRCCDFIIWDLECLVFVSHGLHWAKFALPQGMYIPRRFPPTSPSHA